MTILQMYERVNLQTQLEQRKFFNYLNDTVNEIIALYGTTVTLVLDGDTTEYTDVTALNDLFVVKPLYHNAIIENILFMAGKSNEHKGEFMRKSKEAYFKYWNNNAKSKRILRGGW